MVAVTRAARGRSDAAFQNSLMVILCVLSSNAPAKLQRNQIRVCGAAANNSIDPLSASAFVRQHAHGVVLALLALPLDEAHGSQSPGAVLFVKPQHVDVTDRNA